MDSVQTIFLSGCDSEAGFNTACALIQEGYTVLAAMSSPGFLNQIYAADLLEYSLKEEGDLHVLEMDVSSNSSVGFAAQEALELAGNNIDVIINFEEVGAIGYTETFTVDQFKKLFDVNVFGFQRVCRSFLPYFRSRQSGLVVNVSSMFGRAVLPYAGVYTASRFAAYGLTESYRLELAPLGVEFTMVEPGGFDASVLENMLTMPDDLERMKSYGAFEKLPSESWHDVVAKYQYGDEEVEMITDAILELMVVPGGMRPPLIIVEEMPASEALREAEDAFNRVQDQVVGSLNLEPA